jgi:hypothetical protein
VGCGWGSPREEREGNEWRMASREARRGARGFLSARGGLSVSWSRPSWIGQWCGAFWTALWSLCSDVVGLVEGEALGSETCSFQSVCTACRACLHRSGRLWLRGGSAEGSAHDAVQVSMRHGSGLLFLGWERGARSGRSRLTGDRARAWR